MAVAYLIRHGQASFGAADYDVLSDLGGRQAGVVGAELVRRGVRPSLVRTGAMRRQWDSALACLEAAGIDVQAQEDDRFDEYDHVDVLDRYGGENGFNQGNLEQALRRWVADDANGLCKESWPAFRDRVQAGLDTLLDDCGGGGSAVVFTSGGVISTICAGLLQTPAAGFLALNRVIANASITKIVHGRSGTSLLSFNDHAHFEGGQAELLSYR
jgi:broad specificity phosphatase PhoE